MLHGRLRDLGGPLLLMLGSAVALAGTLPRFSLSSTLAGCFTESPAATWLGIHLQLLAQNDCPEGLVAAGPHYAEVAQFSVMLSLSALVAGAIMLAGALGFGVWARRTLRAARAWIVQRLGLGLAPAPVVVGRSPLAAVPSTLRSTDYEQLQLRRGPPAGCC